MLDRRTSLSLVRLRRGMATVGSCRSLLIQVRDVLPLAPKYVNPVGNREHQD